MKGTLLIITCIVSFVSNSQQVFVDYVVQIPSVNQQVLDTAIRYGKNISPTYESAVCTEFIIGVLGHFMELTSEDTINIRIDQPRANLKEVYQQIENGSPYPKGVVHALVSKGKGTEITDVKSSFTRRFCTVLVP
ncbi:hypothetical protein [Fluviicola taffensis]|uniref:Uncharacterized protein n=1 Tax=Fluviicola taffensis (strain DSM 16823 / NCIMB 13979 / RW262) TaxID=755732 RepID=F2IHL4_FLUTR|nr:hypothetical protein [Fluviicola taffensis]AEA44792.1 hypothetical protein Fluta_2812 [Fluviicola taffensis DSM 16823]